MALMLVTNLVARRQRRRKTDSSATMSFSGSISFYLTPYILPLVYITKPPFTIDISINVLRHSVVPPPPQQRHNARLVFHMVNVSWTHMPTLSLLDLIASSLITLARYVTYHLTVMTILLSPMFLLSMPPLPGNHPILDKHTYLFLTNHYGWETPWTLLWSILISCAIMAHRFRTIQCPSSLCPSSLKIVSSAWN